MARWSRALRLNDTSTFPIPRTSRRWYWICIHTVFFQTAMFGQPFECRKHCATASTAWHYEHLEFQPHLSDIPHPDRNRAYEEAVRAAEGQPVKIIPGVEITRTGDEGHINAVFIKDANPLVKQQTATESLPHTEFPYP